MNENIKSYIQNQFLNSDYDPQFAILIKGKWGCGKTYLIKDYILRDKYGKTYDKNVLYVSLYGLSDVSQISRRILEQKYPLLTSKAAKFAVNLAKAVTKNAIGVDINNDGNTDVSFDFSLPDLTTDNNEINSDRVLVIDDIERCRIPMTEILGYFSDAILNQKLRAIFIGDTSELVNKESAEDFERIKEKVIGMEFEVQPNEDDAISCFITKLHLCSIEAELKKVTKEVMHNLHCQNLRSVRQAYFNIRQLLSLIGFQYADSYSCHGTYVAQQKFVTELSRYFLALFFQKQTGKLKKKDCGKAIQIYEAYGQSLSDYLLTHDDRIWSVRYSFIPFQNSFDELVFDGLFREKKLREEYETYISPVIEMSDREKILKNWWNLDNVEFVRCYELLEQDLQLGLITSQNTFLQMALLYFQMSKDGVIADTLNQVVDKFCNYTVKYAEKLEFHSGSFWQLDNHPSTSFFGEEYQKLLAALDKVNKQKYAVELSTEFNTLVGQLPESIPEFINHIESAYLKYPWFSVLSCDDLVRAIIIIPREKQWIVFHAFETRFTRIQTIPDAATVVKTDIPSFIDLSERLKEFAGNPFMNPEAVFNRTRAEWYCNLTNSLKKQYIGEK